MGLGSCWYTPPPYCHTCQAPPLRATKSLMETEHQTSEGTVGRGQQPGPLSLRETSTPYRPRPTSSSVTSPQLPRIFKGLTPSSRRKPATWSTSPSCFTCRCLGLPVPTQGTHAPGLLSLPPAMGAFLAPGPALSPWGPPCPCVLSPPAAPLKTSPPCSWSCSELVSCQSWLKFSSIVQ